MSIEFYAARPPQPPRRDLNDNRSVALLVIAVLAMLVAGGSLLWQFWPSDEKLPPAHDPKAAQRTVDPRGPLWGSEQEVIQLYSEGRKSVVHIHTAGLRRDRFTFNVFRVPRGTGSGFIWDKSGHVVTNYHVAIPEGENPKTVQVQVTLHDHSQHSARLVGAYPEKDIAVLVLDAPIEKAAELRPIPVGASHDLKVGQSAFAIGNPFGLDQTLTTGIISALGREIETSKDRPPIRNVIQTDAAINPGNSGGPLLDSAGRLIGINTAIYSPSGASAGIGFAIPVDEINRVVTQLIRDGRVPSLGIDPAQEELSRRVHPTGVMILTVNPGGPAEDAGLLGVRRFQDRYVPGDVLIQIGETPIGNCKDYYEVMEKQRVGSVISVVIVRGRKHIRLNVRI